MKRTIELPEDLDSRIQDLARQWKEYAGTSYDETARTLLALGLDALDRTHEKAPVRVTALAEAEKGEAGVISKPVRRIDTRREEWLRKVRRCERTAQRILDARALYPDKPLSWLYDEVTMPPELRAAHAANDRAVMDLYGFPHDMNENEIVSALFDLYQAYTQQ